MRTARAGHCEIPEVGCFLPPRLGRHLLPLCSGLRLLLLLQALQLALLPLSLQP